MRWQIPHHDTFATSQSIELIDADDVFAELEQSEDFARLLKETLPMLADIELFEDQPLRQLRLKRRFTQLEVAGRMQTTRSNVSKLESGAAGTHIELHLLEGYALALGVPSSLLIEENRALL